MEVVQALGNSAYKPVIPLDVYLHRSCLVSSLVREAR